MRRGSFLLAPALALVLTGCGQNGSTRSAAEAQRDQEHLQQEQQEQHRPEPRTDNPDKADRNDTGPVGAAAKLGAGDFGKGAADVGKGAHKAGKGAKDAGKAAGDAGREGARDVQEGARDMSYNRGPRTLQRTDEIQRQSIDIPAGAVLRVRLDQAIDTEHNRPGDTFTATLTEPVVVDGRVAIPKGTRFQGSVTTAESSGRLAGNGVLTVKLDSFALNGKTHKITSTTATRVTDGHKKRDIGIIGGGAAAGAAIGAITGGGKGAAIGAGAGAAAGTGVAAATGKLDVKVPAETVMVFTLQKAVDIKG